MEAAGKPPRAVYFLIAFFASFALLTVGAFLIPWRTEVASEEGGGIDGTITYLLVATGLILLVGHGVLCWFLWGSSRGHDTAHGRPSRRAEWLWSLIPVLLMLLLSEAGVLIVSGPVWASLYAEEPQNPIELEVVGRQFEWHAHYPGKDGVFGTPNMKLVNDQEGNGIGLDDREAAARDDIVKRGAFCLPLGRPVVIHLRTFDVIHSFFVPQFRVKQDLLPNFVTRVKFTPTREGEFELACAELCGLGHYTMRGKITVLKPEAYEAWLAKQFTFGG